MQTIRTAFLWLLALLASPGQEGRLPPPADDAQAQGEKTIRDVFKEEYAVKSTTAQQKLAKTLLQQGVATKDDATLRYVLFRESVDLASRSGDLDTLLGSLDELYKGFAITTVSLKESALSKVESAITKLDDYKRLAEAQLKVVSEACDQDQIDVAARSAQSALSAAKKSRDIGLALRAESVAKGIADAKAGYERAKKAEQTLAQTPDDPGANQAWGDYLCVTKGQWEKGLPFLAKGPDSDAKRLSAKELSGEARVRLEVADGWWELGDKEKSPLRKATLIAHARGLYETALPTLTGLARVKAEKRLGEARAAEPKPPPPPDARQLDGHSYKLFTEQLPWAEAKAFCEKQGGHLVTIASKEEGRFVAGLVNVPQENGPWIGLSYDVKAKVWAWVTGEPVRYTNWQPGEPNYLEFEHAVELFAKGNAETWNNVGGGGRRTFVCEWDR
jgi:hypothetical protein